MELAHGDLSNVVHGNPMESARRYEAFLEHTISTYPVLSDENIFAVTTGGVFVAAMIVTFDALYKALIPFAIGVGLFSLGLLTSQAWRRGNHTRRLAQLWLLRLALADPSNSSAQTFLLPALHTLVPGGCPRTVWPSRPTHHNADTSSRTEASTQ